MLVKNRSKGRRVAYTGITRRMGLFRSLDFGGVVHPRKIIFFNILNYE